MTSAPSSTYSVVAGIRMKPSARPNAVTLPEPAPSGYAASPSLPSTRSTSEYSARPETEVILIGATAFTARIASSGTPERRRNRGATNSWNVKTADVGNPGRTTTGFDATTDKRIGLPGLRATPWTTIPGELGRRSASRTIASELMSPSPFDVPPESKTTSTGSGPVMSPSSFDSTAATSSGAMPAEIGSQPSSRTASRSIGRFESITWPITGSVPGGTISSPVESTATRGRATTAASATPTAARTAVSRDVNTMPRRRIVSPRPMSDPANEIFAPGATERDTAIPSATGSVYSTITIASVPRGTTPPVAICVAVAGGASKSSGGASPAASVTGESASAVGSSSSAP